MASVVAQRMTEKEYLALEAASTVRHEFVNGEVLAMAGAPEHNLVQVGLSAAVVSALRAGGRPCLTFAPDQRVRVSETGLYAYPDLTALCGRPEFDDENPRSLLNPQVIFEVLSPSTEA